MRARTLFATMLATLAAAPAAAAQAPPPDERAAAQTLADAVGRLDAADAATEDSYDIDAAFGSPRCRRELRRVPRRRQDDLRALVLVQELRHIADRLRPALMRFRNELAAAVTGDPRLISGRAAWRRAAKAYMALPSGGDLCADIAAWRRAGYDRRTIATAQVEYRAAFASAGRGFERKIAAAADRMRELGIAEQDAQRFEGDAE